MIYAAAQTADLMADAGRRQDRATQDKHDDTLGFYTPILKGFLTEMGLEAANLGMQVFGGHGYIHEHGMEQIARDARIATLYEGTTGIQALDLLGRKVLLGTRGKCVRDFSRIMLRSAKAWVRQAAVAQTFLRNCKGAESAEFYRAKIQTAEFYFDRLLPRADAHRKSALAPTRSLMQMGNGDFAFS